MKEDEPLGSAGACGCASTPLVADGQPLRNSFKAFGAASTGALMRMQPADVVKTLPPLIGGLRRSKALGKATLQMLPGAEKTIRGMDQALADMEARRTVVQEARATGAAIAQNWETALAALKRGARAAADDGAPTLYAILFDRPERPSSKAAKTPPPAPLSSPAASPPQPEPAAS
jgi:hypothetical protein